MSNYIYTISTDTANGEVSEFDLQREIQDSSITIALDGITTINDDLTISFKSSLSTQEETTLDTVVSGHDASQYADPPIPRDQSGREVVRHAITNDGWVYLNHCIECESSKLDSIYCEDQNGNEETQHYCKFYDANGTELTTQNDIDTDCVKSVFTIKPGIDYEVVCGEIHHHERPTTNFRVHTVMGVIDNSGNHISVKAFVRNLNLKFKHVNKTIMTDGRAPKLLRKTVTGVPFDANQIQVIAYHDAGVKHQFMVELEYYRE